MDAPTRRQILESRRDTSSGLYLAPAPVRMEDMEVDEEKGTIEGYANTWTRDSYNSRFLKGAFARTLRERHLAPIAMGDRSDVNFRLHHRDPCGYSVHLAEDSKGLRAVAQLVDFKSRGTDGYTALILARERVMKGLSIGFDYIWESVAFLSDQEMLDEGLDPTDPEYWWLPPHNIHDCDLREWSLVSDPANADSRVEVVRSIGRLMVPGWRASDPPARPPSPVRSEDGEGKDTPPATIEGGDGEGDGIICTCGARTEPITVTLTVQGREMRAVMAVERPQAPKEAEEGRGAGEDTPNEDDDDFDALCARIAGLL